MQKFRSFIYFLLLTFLWSLFYASVKFYVWGGNEGREVNIDLETLAGFLSIGSALSYLVGGAVAYTFIKKYILIAISILSIVLLFMMYQLGTESYISIGISFTLIGFLYGLWSVMKNVFISIEIKKTGLQDTAVNAYASVIFIVSIILGSILGGVLSERLGDKGIIILIGIMGTSLIVSSFIDYDKQSIGDVMRKGFLSYYSERRKKFMHSMKAYIPDIKYIVKKYYYIMISSALLWASSSVISQRAIEHSVDHFDKTPSAAAVILLYSAIGVILGNIISMKMENSRWKYFFIFNVGFAITTISFPFLSFSFFATGVLAFMVGFFFGGAINLIDAFFFRKIGEENKKEYGSSTFGLLTSIVIFVIMFLSSFVKTYLGVEILMGLLGIIILGIGIVNLKLNK